MGEVSENVQESRLKGMNMYREEKKNNVWARDLMVMEVPRGKNDRKTEAEVVG